MSVAWVETTGGYCFRCGGCCMPTVLCWDISCWKPGIWRVGEQPIRTRCIYYTRFLGAI